jgi:hypothetical protein
MGEDEAVSKARFQGIPLVVRSDHDHRVIRPAGCNSSKDMTMGVVGIQEVKSLPIEIVREMPNVLKIFQEERRPVNFQGMIQMETVRRPDSGLKDPLFDAVLERKGGLPVGKHHIVAPLFQPHTEIHRGIGRTRPFPVAEKLKDFHF